MLTLKDVSVEYSGSRAVNQVSFQVAPGETVAVVGRNGAGKTSLLRAIAGLVRPAGGQIEFDGCDLTRLPAYQIARLGIAMIPEGRQVIAPLSVEENLDMGASFKAPAWRQQQLEAIYARFPLLRERRHQLAGSLSGGEQQVVALGRALMSQPRLLLMDEPSMGLAPKLVHQVFETVRDLQRDGLTILLVEQNVRKALSVAARVLVIVRGSLVHVGTPESLASDSTLLDAYLGETLSLVRN